MAHISGRTVFHLLAGSIALAVAGCGTMTMTSVRTSPSPRTTAVSATQSPRQRANADAASILAAFVPPPGARRLASPPAGVGGTLNGNQFVPGDPDFVDIASLWQVNGKSPLQVLAWEKAHLPGRFKLDMQSGDAVPKPAPRPPGVTSVPGDPYLFGSYGFDLPAVPDILISREMDVAAATSLAGQTYVRVDAEVIWLPPRAASERVPAGVRVITITAQPDMNHPGNKPAPVTITDPARVRDIVTLLDGLNLDTRGVHGCPMETGKGITVAFRGHANGPVLATASEPIPSCGDVRFIIGGTDQPGLGDAGAFTQNVLKIAGVHWPAFNTLRS